MTHTKRIWNKPLFHKTSIQPRKSYASDKKNVSCIRKRRYLRKEQRHKIRAQNRTQFAHKIFDRFYLKGTDLRDSEHFD